MSYNALVDRFTADLERAGATVIRRPGSAKPVRLRVIANDRTTDCLLFLWNITPGGGSSDARPANERRIQVTAAKRFPLEIGRRTIVGGWSEETAAWGFWDVMRHTRFSQNSPSCQINVATLNFAYHDGIATQARKTRPPEVVVAVAPSFLLWYVQDGAVLHNSGPDALAVKDLIEATPEEERTFVDASEGEGQAERRYRLVETMRAVRDAKFRPEVLRAYSHRCALCPFALNLVDAAHIIPVQRPRSTDEVTNGLALCRLHHAAYDGALVGVKSDYSVVINTGVVSRLQELGFAHGLAEFKSLLLSRIRHPAQAEVRPKPEYLRIGMTERNWPADLIG